MAIHQSNRMLGFLPLVCGQSFKKSRCKKLLKISVSRIQLLKDRREIQVKQLRRDVAQLLQFGKEQSARTRLARLWKEQNLLSAYDTLGQYCKLVIPNLCNIGGQRSCPVDLRKPLSSLIFAASSCADLPELQDLREILAMKYGNEFITAVQQLQPDSRVNEEIVESFFSRGPSEAIKQALLEDIAEEYKLSPRFCPRILAPPEDLSPSVEKKSAKCQPGSAEDQRADGNLDYSQNLRSFDRRNPKVIERSGLDEFRGSHNGELLNSVEGDTFQPARSHDSQLGKACLRYVDPIVYAPDGGSRCSREEADFSVAGNGNEVLMCSEKESSDVRRAGECDFDYGEHKHFAEFYDRRQHKEAKSRRTSAKISAKRVINPEHVTLVLSSPANDNENQTDAAEDDSISVFFPKTLPSSFPKPPQRPPPPPPPVRVASSPSLSIQSPPPVSHQRSATLEIERLEEHRVAHVHPKLPQYDDLVARFAALRLKSQK